MSRDGFPIPPYEDADSRDACSCCKQVHAPAKDRLVLRVGSVRGYHVTLTAPATVDPADRARREGEIAAVMVAAVQRLARKENGK